MLWQKIINKNIIKSHLRLLVENQKKNKIFRIIYILINRKLKILIIILWINKKVESKIYNKTKKLFWTKLIIL
jgi:hypothetical protein